MATNDDITIAKGSFSVTLFTITPTENWKNKLEIIPGVTSVDNQVNSPNKSQVVDLQRTTYSYVFGCGITATSSKTAKQIKDDLRTIFEGARTSGGPVTLTYEDSSINVFFEDCVIKKNSGNTVGNYDGKDAIEYMATLKFVEGEKA